MHRPRILMLVAPLALAAGCVDSAEQHPLGTGALLSADYSGDTDVVGFHIEVTRQACDAADTFSPFTEVANVNLIDGIFPGKIELVERSWDPTSRHLGADLFQTLPAGCYRVAMAPSRELSGNAAQHRPPRRHRHRHRGLSRGSGAGGVWCVGCV